MEIEELVPECSIGSIMNNPKKYRKMMFIIQQTLYDLGYHESAKMLEQQSGVSYDTDKLLLIKQYLSKSDYEAAIKIIEQLQKGPVQSMQTKILENGHDQVKIQSNNVNAQTKNNKPQISKGKMQLSFSSLAKTKSMIYETYCMQKILDQSYDEAMKLIDENIQNQQQKQSLCQALVLGNHHLTINDIQKKKSQIFKFCLSQYQDIGERQIQNVIQSYTKHKGQMNKELKKLITSKKFPPFRLLTSQMQQQIRHSITHMKINPVKNQIILIDEGLDYQQIFLVDVSTKNKEYQRQMIEPGKISLRLKYPIFQPQISKEINLTYKSKRQSVESLSCNSSCENTIIALASFSLIQIFNEKLDIISTIQSNNKINKFIHIEFHPISDLLYSCGYLDSMQIMDSNGEQVMTIYPYPKTRKFLFEQSYIFGISLVANKVHQHSAEQQTLIKQIQLDQNALPMDIAISQRHSLLAVSSLTFLYLIDVETLEIIEKTTSPSNPNKLIIQTKFYGDFLLTLCKNFTAYEFVSDKMNQNSKSFVIIKNKEWLGDGTFDVNGQLMVGGSKSICCWEQADEDFITDEQSLEQEMSEPCVLDLQSESEVESQSDIDSNELEDEDIEEDGSMDSELDAVQE